MVNNETTTIKTQKGSKDIVKTVHVTSVVHPSFYDATGILCAQETKITLFNNFFSYISQKYLNLCSEDEQRYYVFGTT